MYRLTIVLGVCAVAFAFATAVQSFRLWKAQDEAAALRGAAGKTQREAHKAETNGKRGGHDLDEDFANTVSSPTAKEKDGRASDTAGEAAFGEGGTEWKPGTSLENKKKPTADRDKSAPAMDPARAGELVRSAQELMKSGNVDPARAALQQSLRADPKNGTAWHQLAQIERQSGNAEAELNTYKQWAEAQPGEKLARYLAAEACIRNGMNDQALKYLTDFQELGRDDPQSSAMVAGLYEQMHMPAEQGEVLRQWASTAPDSPDAHRVLGDYYRQAGQSDLAVAEFQQMVALQPNDPNPYMQLGSTYMQMGKTDEALTQFLTAVSLRPNSTEALTRLAGAQRQSGDTQGAVANYQRIVDLEPGSPVGVDAAQTIQSIQAEAAPQRK